MKKCFQIYFFILLVLLIAGCSDRIETPVTGDHNTIYHLPKNENGISAEIILASQTDTKTGTPVDNNDVFVMREDAKVNAFIQIKNRKLYLDKELVFHIDWIKPDGNSFFRKQINLESGDSTSVIESSISIPPERKDSGFYFLRIYLFRELITERKFELITESNFINTAAATLSARIKLYSKSNKKTGKLEGEGAVFRIKKKANVRALVQVKNWGNIDLNQLSFTIDWIGPDLNSIYKKEVGIEEEDSVAVYKSSISIPPKKRDPGDYLIRFYLYDKILAEKNFELKAGSK